MVLGEALIQNVILKPGNNTVALSGRIDLRKVLQNLSEIVAAQREALSDGEIELSATGNKTIYDGQHIPYFERVLNNLTLTARVPIMRVMMDTLQGLGSANGTGSVWEKIESLGNGGGDLTGLLDGL